MNIAGVKGQKGRRPLKASLSRAGKIELRRQQELAAECR